jgi:hypothetical protein
VINNIKQESFVENKSSIPALDQTIRQLHPAKRGRPTRQRGIILRSIGREEWRQAVKWNGAGNWPKSIRLIGLGIESGPERRDGADGG